MKFMENEDIFQYWVTEADESNKIAKHLFDKKDYSYSLFFGHLAVEKMIKAIYVKNISEKVPRSHNLLRLAKEAKLHIPDDKRSDLIRITAFNLEARYPDYKKEFRKKCTIDFTKVELSKIKEVLKWLKSTL